MLRKIYVEWRMMMMETEWFEKSFSYRSKLAIVKIMIKNYSFSVSVILVTKYDYVNSSFENLVIRIKTTIEERPVLHIISFAEFLHTHITWKSNFKLCWIKRYMKIFPRFSFKMSENQPWGYAVIVTSQLFPKLPTLLVHEK